MVDPKALAAADKILFRNTTGFQGAIDLPGALQAYLDAADLVPRVQMDNAVSKKLMTAVEERDEARLVVRSQQKDVTALVRAEVDAKYQAEKLGKQVAALREALTRLINKVNELEWPVDPLMAVKHGIAPSQDWRNIHSLKGCIEQARAASTDTAEAAAQYQLVEWQPIETAMEAPPNILVCVAGRDDSVAEAYLDQGRWNCMDGSNGQMTHITDPPDYWARLPAAAPTAKPQADHIIAADLSPDQKEYVDKLIDDQEKGYDPTVVIGGPQADEPEGK